jgi:cytochrome b pre-mRNA-processing protein 3
MVIGLFGAKPKADPAGLLYAGIVAGARRAGLFGKDGVADDLDGRFEMLVLHAALTLRRLRAEGPAGRELAQQVFDLMFLDLDRTLREMGVGDLSVPKRIKAMARAFYGRARAYDQALDGGQAGALADTFARNAFAGAPERQAKAGARRMAATARAAADGLAGQSGEALLAGQVAWPEAGLRG